jgi:hypothetical protein
MQASGYLDKSSVSLSTIYQFDPLLIGIWPMQVGIVAAAVWLNFLSGQSL